MNFGDFLDAYGDPDSLHGGTNPLKDADNAAESRLSQGEDSPVPCIAADQAMAAEASLAPKRTCWCAFQVKRTGPRLRFDTSQM
jgi:hypothetical protein